MRVNFLNLLRGRLIFFEQTISDGVQIGDFFRRIVFQIADAVFTFGRKASAEFFGSCAQTFRRFIDRFVFGLGVFVGLILTPAR